MPFGIVGRTGLGMRQVVWFGDWSRRRSTFGGNLGHTIVTNAYVCKLTCFHYNAVTNVISESPLLWWVSFHRYKSALFSLRNFNMNIIIKWWTTYFLPKLIKHHWVVSMPIRDMAFWADALKPTKLSKIPVKCDQTNSSQRPIMLWASTNNYVAGRDVTSTNHICVFEFVLLCLKISSHL